MSRGKGGMCGGWRHKLTWFEGGVRRVEELRFYDGVLFLGEGVVGEVGVGCVGSGCVEFLAEDLGRD